MWFDIMVSVKKVIIASVNCLVLVSVTVVPQDLSGISSGVKSPPCGADKIIGLLPGNMLYNFQLHYKLY